MCEIEVKIKKFTEILGTSINIPTYATTGSAGMDLYACINEPIEILPER